MQFLVLAIDFDGTSAVSDELNPSVKQAIGELRSTGIVVVLVTGRVLEDLRRVAGDLHFVDAIVAENGAVIHFPDSQAESVLAEAVSPSFLDALRAEGIAFATGQVLVEADADAAARILAVVRRLELPLSLAFNRGRVMVMPQSISKATGIKRALAILRLSPHNAVAIGDAENDHELLAACEVGVAVEWGSEALKKTADYVIDGRGPSAVAEFLSGLGHRRRVSMPIGTRRRLTLGHLPNGDPFTLSVRGRNVLVAGDPKSGKSWVTGLLAEQLILYGYSVCIIDPEGDYLSLEALPGVRILGGADPLPRPRELLRSLRHADVSLVIDLSHTPYDQKCTYIRHVLAALGTFRRETGLPHRIIVDEAHYFLHDPDVLQLLDLELNGYTLVSYRASLLHSGILAATEALIVTRESDPVEVRSLKQLCSRCDRDAGTQWETLLGQIPTGEAVVLPITEEAEGQARRIRLSPRLTRHVRHMAKYIDIPIPESRGFVFAQSDGTDRERVRTLQDFAATVERRGLSTLDGHLRRGDFSKWVTDVFGDHPLGKAIQGIEEDYRRGRRQNVRTDIGALIRARYRFEDPVISASAR